MPLNIRYLIPANNLSDITNAATGRTNLGAAPVASPTFTGAVTLAQDPASALQAVTRQYADGLAVNLGKRQRVRAGTTANITIATALNNGDVLDGVTLATSDLVLVKNQTAQEQNGIYVVGVTPVRFSEFDTYSEHPGSLFSISEGTVNADTIWLCMSNAGGTIDVTAILFSQSGTSGALLAPNNLSDLHNPATARTNIGLAIGVDVDAFAPAASQAEAEAGTGTEIRNWSSQRIAQAIAALAPAGNPLPVTGTQTVHQHSQSAKAGDLVWLFGENFGTVPTVYLNGAPIAVVNSYGSATGPALLVAQLPVTASMLMQLQIVSGGLNSAIAYLNKARPWGLDATELHPSGAFRIFGRSLKVGAYTAVVTVDGLAAAVDVAASNENLLVCTAPAGITTNATAVIIVDNGLGSATTLDTGSQAIAVNTTGSGDPYGLGVGWGARFSAIAASVTAATGMVASPTDMTANIQGQINTINAAGGGELLLPAGTFRIGQIDLKNNVVLRGAGESTTTIEYTAQAINSTSGSIKGVMDLTFTAVGSVGTQDGPVFSSTNKLFFKNVTINTKSARWSWLNNCENIALINVDFLQSDASGSIQGSALLDSNRGFVMTGCSGTWWRGVLVNADKVRHAYIAGNTFTRDAAHQHLTSDTDGISHTFTINFTYRSYIGGNTFATINGPVLTSNGRNDGEQILSEGGGGNRTENRGTVTSADATHFTDSGNTIDATPGDYGSIPENYYVSIVAGKGVGQARRITAIAGGAGGQVTISPAWAVIPDTTSKYATAVAVDKVVLRDNTFSAGGSRGIWIYQCNVFDMDVVGNTLTNSGGIYARKFQNNTAQFNHQWNINYRDNVMTASGGTNSAVISSLFVNNTSGTAFGVASIGEYFRDNVLDANNPDYASGLMDQADPWEGYGLRNSYEAGATYGTPSIPGVLGGIFQSNSSTDANNWLHISTGVHTTTIKAGTLTNSGAVSDATAGGSGTASINTVTV